MICSLIIMTIIFINGIENAEQKVKHLDRVLKEEEINAKAKVWLLMVESGKVDEEELRRITPKSIFIAPLLSSRSGKCPDGYTHDHLGQCVKVIKTDPKVQLELLLKKLNTLYSDNKKEKEEKEEDLDEEEEEEEKKKPSEPSSGPLQFSIPILNEGEKEVKQNYKNNVQSVNKSTLASPVFAEFMPVPLPVVMSNETKESIDNNNTKEFDFSGAGPLNDTESFLTPEIEGAEISSGDFMPVGEETTTVDNIFMDDSDYLDANETESTTEIRSTTLDTTETVETTTVTPVEEMNSTVSYQSITDSLNVNDSVVGFIKQNVQNSEQSTKDPKSEIIHFPTDDDQRNRLTSQHNSNIIRFPDQLPSRQQVPVYSPHQFHTQYHILPSAIPTQQFWWLPKNWKVDETQQKSALIKFWSRMPLIHDVSNRSDNSFKKPLLSSPILPQGFVSRPTNIELINTFNHQPLIRTRQKTYRRTDLFKDPASSAVQNIRIQR